MLRHNKPFNGYTDEWTVTFGDIEPGEDKQTAAIREVREEFGITAFSAIKDLHYTTTFVGKHGPTEAHFFAMQAPDISTPIVLNEESIGYDWVTIGKAKELMRHGDEYQALQLL